MRYFFIKIILIATLLVGLFLIIFKFDNIFYFPDSNWKMNRDQKTELLPNKPVVQKFRTSNDGLTAIEILFGRSSLKKVSGKIHFQILEENCQNKIADVYLIPQNINSDNSNTFKFNKIINSENKTYCFKLIFETENLITKNPFVFINPSDSPDNIFLADANSNELKNQSLSMRPAYKNDNLWQDAVELNKRISQYKPWFLKHYYLAFVSFSFLILSVLLVMILIII